MTDPDSALLAQLIELAGPAQVWRPDTAEERADRAAITEALMPAQMEVLSRGEENPAHEGRGE